MSVTRAREAAERGDWEEAYDLFMTADAEGLLGPAELPLLAEVAYAAGHLDVTIDAWERTHTLCVEAGDPGAAAGAAVRVAMHLLLDTALMAPVRGWLARAERLLEGQDETPAHAWLAVVRTYERMLTGDVASAREASERAIELGSRFDPAAAAVGRVAAARLRILDGDVEEGLALLDEVGVAAVSGNLDALSTGLVYCELVCALQGVAQYDVAEEWTQAMERWCQTNAIGSLRGRCRVHRAEILRLRGACDEAEQEALAACDELSPYLRREMGWPLSELGRIRLRRGDIDGAEEALLAAHRVGWEPEPGLALVRLARGDAAAAAAAIRDALDRPAGVPSKELPPDSDLQRAPLLDAQVEIEIAAGDLDRARGAARSSSAWRPGSRARRWSPARRWRGDGCSLAEGQATEAERCCGEAARQWNQIGAPYEAAVARMVRAEALRVGGSEDQAELELQAARTILERHRGRGDRDDGRNVFRLEGDYWSVTYQGRTVHVRDLQGMRYLAQLLAPPGSRVPRAGSRRRRRRASSPALGDAGRDARRAGQERLPPPAGRDRGRHRTGAGARGRQARGAGRRRARVPAARALARRGSGWSRPAGRIGVRARATRRDPRRAPGDRADRRAPPRARRAPRPRRSHGHVLLLRPRPRRSRGVDVVVDGAVTSSGGGGPTLGAEETRRVNTNILPLAITMMAGPQIMSAIIFVTSARAVRTSLAFVIGVLVAVTAGVSILLGLHSLLDLDLGSSSDSGSTGHIIQYVLIALLVAAAIRNYVQRKTIEPPKWLGKLQEAGPREALKTGLLVIGVMPSDLVVMATVATNLTQNDHGLPEAVPFILLTALIAALPLLGYLLFHRRAVTAMPKLRDWMNANSWLVNIIVCAIFLVLIA